LSINPPNQYKAKKYIMKKVATFNGYDFYTGVTKKGIYYNIVPEGTPAPKGGYYDKKYILSIKGLPDCF